ncbi:carbohydrate ABC transporter permease [Agromyces aerolatus]|uniref:carbohydrate ABC transporter permease n=1 Tax=Agromyces sp. LY-1074 TaxID=3074080 RepID=UPI00285C74E4|nr:MULTISPECIES: carbohydrate ABC transporter permease [unclassified Agromyces]MDR5699739.1 carbohydrate ABC transporter permease [Agromyces sp. LY-1074]MDR5706035.1 carbohydrate ABC transporter permease [Agromyces sp. LY-1358]
MISRRTRRWFRLVAIALGLVYLVPLLWVVLTSLKTQQQVLKDPNGVIFAPTLDTYADVVGDGIGAILTSLQIAVVVTAVVLLLAVPAAFALARRISRRWSIVIAVVLAALLVLQMVPQPMTVIPLYSVLASWGLLGSLGGLILADIALLLPFAIMLLRPFVLAIPTSVYEAAELDGAGRWQTFRRIAVPMLGNGIVTVLAIVFISVWGEFVYAINFLPQGVVLPVSGLLAQQSSVYSTEWNSLMALAVITSLPLLLVFLISQKRLISGLALGAVK